jgi:hypothetical protein
MAMAVAMDMAMDTIMVMDMAIIPMKESRYPNGKEFFD